MSETIGEAPVLINPANLKSEPIDRPHSPESNCAICLEEFTNKSFTNSCLHQFCYNCLKEWSKIKPECPLCKQRFHTIIYNVRSLDDFEEYHVNTPNIEFDQTVFINFAFPTSPVPYSFRNPALDFRRNAIDFRQRMAVEADVYPPMNASSSMLYIREVNGLVRTADTIHPAVLPLEHEFRPPNLGLSRYRRDIYRRGRWVRPAQSSRVRQSSPSFYRLNPAQTHRLVPWLTRELNVLLDISIDPQSLVQEILNLITLYPIQSRHFREAIRPHFGERTEHFVHEFYHFAISPHDIVSYDIMAEYGPQDTRPHRLAREESSESDSDVEVVNILRGNVAGGMNGLDLSNHAGPSNIPAFTETVIEISDDSSSSDDEVEIVGMISPVTPETILIESTDEEINEPLVGINGNSLLNSSATKSNDSSLMEQDFDPNQPGTSTPVISHPFKSFSPIAKDTTTSSSSTSSSSSSSSTSSSSSSPSSSVYSSSLSSVSDSDYGKKRPSHKRKKRKTVRHDKIKRRRRRTRLESSSSEDDFPSKQLLSRRLKSVVIKPEDKSILSGSYSDSD